MTIIKPHNIFIFSISAALFACAAPRSITQSGRVTPHGEVRLAVEGVMNTPVGTSLKAGEGLIDAADWLVDAYNSETELSFDQRHNTLYGGAIAYTIDPLKFGWAAEARYGFLPGMDAGYKYAMGAHVFDTRFQFLGRENTNSKAENCTFCPMQASIGLTFASQEQGLPSFLSSLETFLGFSMSRKDLIVPLLASIPLGPQEKYGAISFGVLYSYSFLNLSLEPKELRLPVAEDEVNDTISDFVEPVYYDHGFSSYGGMMSIKGGYKWIYAGLGMAVYYQNYGSYQLLLEDEMSLSGLSFVPNVFIEFRHNPG